MDRLWLCCTQTSVIGRNFPSSFFIKPLPYQLVMWHLSNVFSALQAEHFKMSTLCCKAALQSLLFQNVNLISPTHHVMSSWSQCSQYFLQIWLLMKYINSLPQNAVWFLCYYSDSGPTRSWCKRCLCDNQTRKQQLSVTYEGGCAAGLSFSLCGAHGHGVQRWSLLQGAAWTPRRLVGCESVNARL